MTHVLTRLMPNDPRAGRGPTVAEWLREERGGAFVRHETDGVVTLDQWLRGGGDESNFKVRMMPAINRWARKTLSVDDVHVRGSYVCNDQRDYYYSRFTEGALNEAAELIVGAPKMRMHNTRTGSPEGRTFDAQVVTRDGKRWLRTSWYTLANAAGNDLVERVDGGMDDQDSIGWSCIGADCTECGEPIWACRHIPGDIYSRGFAEFEFSGLTRVAEDSFVHQGGQKGTSHFIPDGGERSETMAAVASAVNRFMEALSGDVRWDAIADMKREFLIDMPRMPREVRVAAESYRRAMGMGTLCAEPGARANTQAIACTKAQFPTVADAARWVREHDFRADRRRTTTDHFVFDQFPQERVEKDTLEERKLDPGVSARIGALKAKDGQRVDEPSGLERWLTGARAA